MLLLVYSIFCHKIYGEPLYEKPNIVVFLFASGMGTGWVCRLSIVPAEGITRPVMYDQNKLPIVPAQASSPSRFIMKPTGLLLDVGPSQFILYKDPRNSGRCMRTVLTSGMQSP